MHLKFVVEQTNKILYLDIFVQVNTVMFESNGPMFQILKFHDNNNETEVELNFLVWTSEL